MSKLRIPYAVDGTRFDPVTCRRANGYTVGEKGNERTVAKFEDALRELNFGMPKPRWRRPNPNGNWGIVIGVGYDPT
jgi:hypothetical protein